MINHLTIPATTDAVEISNEFMFVNNAGEAINLLRRGDAGINPVTIQGVEGTLWIDQQSATSSHPIYYFSRTSEGEAVEITEFVPIETDASLNRKDDIAIIFVGQNNGYESIDQLIEQQQSMIEHLGHDQYLILGLTTGTAEQRAELEERLQAEYGSKFINLRAYLSADGLTDANIEPTSQDYEEMEQGKVPASLLEDSEIVGNQIYHDLIAAKILNQMIELNYLNTKQLEYLGIN